MYYISEQAGETPPAREPDEQAGELAGPALKPRRPSLRGGGLGVANFDIRRVAEFRAFQQAIQSELAEDRPHRVRVVILALGPRDQVALNQCLVADQCRTVPGLSSILRE